MIMVVDKISEAFQVLSPVVIGVSRDPIAVLMPASEHIVVGKIIWVGGERGDEE